ncbi:MAG: PQQ-binding-like beta-propeller repeat protein, partial [Anaerolineae bacterium]|nr:PQQ-binding-like beta-propeller repeat protein [Anaerolineae bacterium]
MLKAKIICIFALLILISGCAGRMPASGWSSPIVSGETLYIGSPRGRVYALDAATGQKRWETKIVAEKSTIGLYS